MGGHAAGSARGAAPRFLGRVGTALVFSVGALIPLITMAALTTKLLDALEWLRIARASVRVRGVSGGPMTVAA